MTKYTPEELARRIAAILDDKLAADIKILHVFDKTTVADYFVIAGGNSTTQVRALASEVDFKLGEEGITPLRSEGTSEGSWAVLDYGCVLVHVFLPDARAFYNLDKLWTDSREVFEEQ